MRARARLNFNLSSFVALLNLVASSSAHAAASPPNVTVAGNPILIWSAVDSLHRCNQIDVPDIPPRVFLTGSDSLAHMIVGSTNYHIMKGPSILNVTRNCTVAWNMTGDPDPSHFAADEFLDSSVSFPNNTVYSLVHTEYPGNLYHNCNGSAYPYCWTVTIGLAVSHDGGNTWAHALPPPAHLVAAVPYPYNQSQLAYGWGDPSNILLNPKDGYYYAAIWNRDQVGLQPPGVCMMRTADVSTPSSWRGWGGETFNISFVSPYTMEPGTEGDHICAVTNLPSCPLGSMVWSSYMNQFVATMDCSLQSGSQFYLSTSDDLLVWSTPQYLYSRNDLPKNVSELVTAMSYPVFLDPQQAPGTTSGSGDGGGVGGGGGKGVDLNFNTVGQNPYLYWVSIGHSPYTDGRNVWATPMHFN